MNPKPTSLERALEEAVSRALRDNMPPLQRTANELQQAYSDLVAACASTRPSNALPAMLRAQTAAAALSAGLSVLSNFVAAALHPHEGEATAGVAESTLEPQPDHRPAAPQPAAHPPEHEIELIAEPEPQDEPDQQLASPLEALAVEEHTVVVPVEPPPVKVRAFDVAALPAELQDLHRRASRVAKVAMQDIKLLRPKDVESGRQHKDLCERLRVDLDKARKEYDRRFRAISDHPVDYFHHWMLEILAGGDSAALGQYPYPSTVVRH